MASPPRLQEMLRAAVQGLRWTYSLFWQLCPHQGVLVWGEGYYNGAIKTRKTVQPMEVSAEEASLHRSQQLRELYDSLAAGGESTSTGNQQQQQPPLRRPTAALQPEDLTESEWFYLMCVSFSFPLGVGLPGKAYARRQHVWLTGANEADSKVFSRAILAKSACIQTVMCVPIMGGVLELGTTERVQEDLGLMRLAKSFFLEDDHLDVRRVRCVSKPALSEQSTSNPASVEDPTNCFRSSPPLPTMFTALDLPSSGDHGDHKGDQGEEGEDEDKEDQDDVESDSEVGTGKYSCLKANPSHDPDSDPVPNLPWGQISHYLPPPSQPVPDQPSELMQMELSEDIRLGSPEEYSNTLEAEIQMIDATHSGKQLDPQRQLIESYGVHDSDRGTWPLLQEDLTGGGLPIDEVLSQEDAQYFETVSGILERNAGRWANSEAPSSSSSSAFGASSAFSKWSTCRWESDRPHHRRGTSSSQRALKYVLFTVPFLHAKSRDPAVKFRKCSTSQDELSANHVLAERRRREKLNERFIILRSLVPFVTRMDKASILGDTIEYVKQLRKKIQDLESRNRNPEPETTHQAEAATAGGGNERSNVSAVEKRKVRVVEGNGGGNTKTRVVAPVTDSLQVSIIEDDALLELQCPDRLGLLLEIMQMMHRLRLEVTAVHSSTTDGVIVAKLRAKVKNDCGSTVRRTHVRFLPINSLTGSW
uniref:Transparent testa 8 n=1 Tax=Aristolochia lindneri TaxID=387572 RepID=A0A8A8GU22_9MAGN|nr:transparent testa 8 [Aristolochia lindneri]